MTRIFIKKAYLEAAKDSEAYYNQLPAVQCLRQAGGLTFTAPVTFFVGENGSGKSTLLEALAVAAGFNPEGGSKNFNFSTQETHSDLWNDVQLVRGAVREKDGYFLRAESYYNVASSIDSMDAESHPLLSNRFVRDSYGGKSLHEMSHGESFLALVINRLGGKGLYIFDEPEAALSPANQLTLLAALDKLVHNGSQVLCATHSPMVMAYPKAEIFEFDEQGLTPKTLKQTKHYSVTTRFLADPGSVLRELIE